MGELIRKIKLSFSYYRSFAPFNVAITLLCAFALYTAGIIELSTLTLLKVLILAFSFFLAKVLRPHELYYYRNLEISQLLVWTVAGVTDILLYAVIMALTSLFIS